MKINIPVFHQQPHTKRTNQINLCTNTFPYRDNIDFLYYFPMLSADFVLQYRGYPSFF